MVAIRADESKVTSKYLFAVLRSEEAQRRIANMHVGTLIPHFKKGDFGKLFLPAPPRSVQEAIGELYFDLSLRIDLLIRTNATLESIAHALFKSWFIDFDPVRAKAEGREPEGMDAATAALFPAEFDESALGLIPKGWRVGCLADIADVIDCLHSKKPILLPEGNPFLQLNNIRDDGLLDAAAIACVSDADYTKWISRIEVHQGDCVITNVGRVGAVSQVPPGLKAAMGRNMTAIRLRLEAPYPSFLIQLLLSRWMREEIKRRTDVGTILDALNVRSIPKLQFFLADGRVLLAAELMLRPLRASMESNLQRASHLANIRDTLLPRLISGKLRLPEAQAQLEDALA
jgi:type I restriction enzyme S subunit